MPAFSTCRSISWTNWTRASAPNTGGYGISENLYYAAVTNWYNLRMLKSIEGVFRDGKVELLEPPPQAGESRVVITFLPACVGVDLKDRGIDEAQAAGLRGRLQTIAEDWQRPEMGVYDDL